MKYAKNKQKKKYGGLIAAAVILLAVILGMVIWLMIGRIPETEPTEPTTAAAEETTAAEGTETVEESTEPTKLAEIVELINGEIQTPYGTLHYPDELADHLIIVQTSSEPYTLEFYAAMEEKAEIRLFDISLGEDSGGNMGYVTTPSGEVPLNVTIYTLSFDETWTEGEIITAYAMQDVINDMIEQLAPKALEDTDSVPVIEEQPENTDTVNYLEIVTPDCTMYYPARWQNSLQLVHDESQEGIYKVHFYGKTDSHEPQQIFSIYIGGDEGDQLGAVMGADGVPVPVNILISELNLEGWAEDDAEILYSMQEAANQLIEKLKLI